jgi:hypothetical protein
MIARMKARQSHGERWRGAPRPAAHFQPLAPSLTPPHVLRTGCWQSTACEVIRSEPSVAGSRFDKLWMQQIRISWLVLLAASSSILRQLSHENLQLSTGRHMSERSSERAAWTSLPSTHMSFDSHKASLAARAHSLCHSAHAPPLAFKHFPLGSVSHPLPDLDKSAAVVLGCTEP